MLKILLTGFLFFFVLSNHSLKLPIHNILHFLIILIAIQAVKISQNTLWNRIPIRHNHKRFKYVFQLGSRNRIDK